MSPAMHILRQDLIATLVAAGLFTFIAFIPGYVLSWIADVLDFRSQTAGWRFVIAVPVSIAACPILAYWIDKLAGRTAVWVGFSLCWCGFAILLAGSIRRAGFRWRMPSKSSATFALVALLWIVIVVGSVTDIPLGPDRLYTSVSAADQSYRTAFTDSITRTGISHPVNPLYSIDGPAPLRYHYFWFILCSLVDQLGGEWVGARQAFVASIIWCGIALGCTIAAFLRFFVPEGLSNIRERSLRGLLLLAVTGLDIIPTLLLARSRLVYLDMEWWNEAVTSWMGSLLWVPNHVGGLVSGLIAFLIIWHAASATRPAKRWMGSAMAGLALASMLGESIYVGLVFAVFLSLWTVITFLAGWRNHTWLLAVAGVITVVLAIPYLKSLTGEAAGGTFVEFTVRRFQGSQAFGLTTEFPQIWKTYLARLLWLPLNYFIELGLFSVVGVLYITRLWFLKRFEPGPIAAATLVLTSVGICTFLKSGVISNNDLGWRGFLPAQFMLLIWAVEFFSPPERWAGLPNRTYALLSPVLHLLLVIGTLSTAYSLGMLRMGEIFNDRAPEYAAGKRMYAAREVYTTLRTLLGTGAIVQQNPALENPVSYGLYSNRQTSVAEPGCGATFGGSMQKCREVYPALAAVFQPGARAEDVDAICRRLSIDALVVTSGDPVWNASDSWIWKRVPAVSTNFARAFLMAESVPEGATARK